MRGKKTKRISWFLCLALLVNSLSLGLTGNPVTVKAAVVKTSYTIQKGKTVTIRKMIKENKNLSNQKTKDLLKQLSELTWESSDPEIVRVQKKKLKGKKAGSAKISGYDKDEKKVIRIKVLVKNEPKPSLIRDTSSGKVKGKKTASGKTMVWYGIPYAATTAGENRWKAPQPVEPWDGIRSAKKTKKRALHYDSDNGYAGTANCLYVNVYRPYSNKKNLPVLVYLHGGGNVGGTANVKFSQMASKMDAVIVSVSYRVGAFGFFYHPAIQDGTDEENSGNFTLLDIRESLNWVQSEIGAFGGDAKNVTLSGFSGGARDVLMCLLSTTMSGLFHKAIVLSGGFTLSTPEEGKTSAEKKLANVLVNRGSYTTTADAKKYIESLSNEELKSLFYGLTAEEVAGMYHSANLKLTDFPQGFMDGVVLPQDGTGCISRGEYNRVPVILGGEATEFSSFGWKGGFTSFDTLWQQNNGITEIQEIIRKGIYYGSRLQSSFYVEQAAQCLYEDSDHKSVYAFRMKWGTNAKVVGDSFYCDFVGAYHGQTRDFLLANYKHRLSAYVPDAVSSENEKGRVALTGQIRKYFYNFMKKGNPNGKGLASWTTWNSASGVPKIMSFDAKKKKTNSKMSTQMYQKEEVLEQMKNNLNATEYSALMDVLFADRFFL